MIWFIIALILLLILFFFLMYRRKEPCIHFYEGSLGLGKTLLCVKEGKRLYKKNVAKWRREMKKRRRYGRIHNLDVEYLEPPKLVTNIELYLSKYKYAERFKDELWTKKLPNGSVCIFDEVGNIKGLSQNDSGKSLMNSVFDEYFRYFRQDTKGGYIVCNDQAFSNCNNVFRRRVNVINKIDAFKIFICFGFVTFRVYDVINDEQRPRLDKKGRQVVKTKICILKKGEYDTYAHYEKSKDKQSFVSDFIIPISSSSVSDNHISINSKKYKEK